MKQKPTKRKATESNLDPTLAAGKCVSLHPYLKEYIGYCMLRVALRIRASIDRELAIFGLVAPQFGMLVLLRESGPMTQIELGSHMSIDKATMVRLLDILEAKKFLTRTTAADDRRAKRLEITASGKQALVKMDALRRKAENEVLAGLSMEERDQLRKTISKLIATTSDLK
jgi:MarR family transcriptional regulator for hemolysin